MISGKADDEVEEYDNRVFSVRHGKVVDNADPAGRGRIRVMIPALIDESEWAVPASTMGGGSTDRGFFAVPKIGADVFVQFVMGDIEYPIYTSAHWGNDEISGSPDVAFIVYGNNKIELSEAESALTITTSQNTIRLDDDGNSVEISGARGSVTIDGSTGRVSVSGVVSASVSAVGSVSINAPSVSINGRPVSPFGGPI